MDGRSVAATVEAKKAPLSAAAAIEAIPKDFIFDDVWPEIWGCAG